MLLFFSLFGTIFLATQYLQLIAGYSPLEAGVRLLPQSIVMVALAPQAPKAVNRFGANVVAGAGLFIIAASLLLLAVWGSGRHFRVHPQVDSRSSMACCSAGLHHGAAHRRADVVRPTGQGRGRVRHERHDPRAGRRPRRGPVRLDRGRPVRLRDRRSPGQLPGRHPGCSRDQLVHRHVAGPVTYPGQVGTAAADRRIQAGGRGCRSSTASTSPPSSGDSRSRRRRRRARDADCCPPRRRFDPLVAEGAGIVSVGEADGTEADGDELEGAAQPG